MRRFIVTLLSLVLLVILTPTVSADVSYRVPVESVISKRSITVVWGPHQDRYLLYLGKGCGFLEEGQNIHVNARNALQGTNGDAVRVDQYRSCDIERADLIDQTIQVTFINNAHDWAVVVDESDTSRVVFFDQRCRPLAKYDGETVFAWSGGRRLDKGDRLILPNNDGYCSITAIETQQIDEPEEITDDRTNPSVVGNVKVVPENGRVFLTWNAATDNVAVSHYLISVADGRIDTRKPLGASDMPNVHETTRTQYTLNDLQNDETHFIYIAAVDTSGNLSAHWTEVIAHPKSASFEHGSASIRPIDLRVESENDRSTHLEWEAPLNGYNYQLTLRVDGKVVWTEDYSNRSQLWVMHQNAWAGRTITLTATRYNLYGFVDRDSIAFTFE